MKLLLDQNVSRKLVSRLTGHFPGSLHTSSLGLERSDDRDVWDRAKADGFMIVSKDTDLLHLALLHGHPPKVVYLEVGNCPTHLICDLLTNEAPTIQRFADDPLESFLILRRR